MSSHAPPQTRPTSSIAATPALAWMHVFPALALLGLAMAATAVIAPAFSLRTDGSVHPDYAVIAGTGVVMIVLSSVFLAYARRVMDLGLAWLLLALLTNALVLVAMFVLVPVPLYQVMFDQGEPSASASEWPFFQLLAAILFFACTAVLGAMYVYMRGQVSRALGQVRRPLRLSRPVVGLIIGALVLASPLLLVGGFVVFFYGAAVAFATGGAVTLVILAALAAGTGTLWEAARRGISLRNTAFLTSVSWLGLSMLLIYHEVWVVFMTAIFNCWPLPVKTVVAAGGK